MFNYHQTDGSIRFNVSQGVLDYLLSRRESLDRQIDCILSNYPESNASSNRDVAYLDPGVNAVIAFRDGFVTEDRLKQCIQRFTGLGQDYFRMLRSCKIQVAQFECLFPEIETRGKKIEIYSSEFLGSIVEKIHFDVKNIDDFLGPGWLEMRSIIKTITVVDLIHQPNIPYFSGSCSEYWGAMHIGQPGHISILTETIAHEAAHFWLHALEESSDFCEGAWDGAGFISPWREDPRPIAGLIHGVGVFSCSLITLSQQVNNSFYKEDDTAMVAQRVCRLIAQVEAGYEEIIASGQYTVTDRSFLDDSLSSIQSSIAAMEALQLSKARDRVLVEQKAKRRQFFG